MPDDAPDKNGSEEPSGVFGNLPRSRPGARSPRRAGGPASAAATRAAAPGPPPGAEREPAAAAPGAAPRITSAEDLAWAGVAVAAQAATLGVRFASRAYEAARKSVERP